MNPRGALENLESAAPAHDTAQRTFLARLAAAGEILTTAAPGESPVAAVARALLVLTEADHAAIFLRSPTGVVTCPWSHNLSEQYVAELVTPSGINPWIHILRHPELTCMDLPKTRRRADPAPWILRDVRELTSDQAALSDRLTRENVRSMRLWPLSRDGRVIAALAYCYDAAHELAEEEEKAVHALAAQAATALGAGIAQSSGSATRGVAERTRAAQEPVAAEETGITAGRSSPEAERHRLADAQETSAERDERVERTRRTLEADTERLAAEREQITAAWREVEAAQARTREAREAIASEQQRLADAGRALEDERARLAEAQRDHAAEGQRLAEARRQLEAERAQLAAAGAAVPLHDENVRLEALRRDLEAQEARLAGDRAALEADTRRLADTQAALVAERDRLAELRRRLEAEAARLDVERRAAQTERAQPPQTQARPEATDAAPEKDRRSAHAGESREPASPNVDVAGTPPAEARGATTYADLVERAGAGKASDDKQIAAIARRLDAHNSHAADYSKRLAEWAEALARALACSDQEILSTRRAALLHDIGKIDVPAAILKKAAGLTDDELAMFQKEPAIAHQMLKDVTGLSDVATILRHRFERWDGAGHPDGLKGEAIPLGARIVSVVDAYGEMITGRPGVPKLYYRDAISAVQRESGARFDPKIITAFRRIAPHG